MIDYNGCPYCKQSVEFYVNNNSDVAVKIVDDRIVVIRKDPFMHVDDRVALAKIRYCPICGKKVSKEGERGYD